MAGFKVCRGTGKKRPGACSVPMAAGAQVTQNRFTHPKIDREATERNVLWLRDWAVISAADHPCRPDCGERRVIVTRRSGACSRQ